MQRGGQQRAHLSGPKPAVFICMMFPVYPPPPLVVPPELKIMGAPPPQSEHIWQHAQHSQLGPSSHRLLKSSLAFSLWSVVFFTLVCCSFHLDLFSFSHLQFSFQTSPFDLTAMNCFAERQTHTFAFPGTCPWTTNLALHCDCVSSWIAKQLQKTLLGSYLCWTPCAMATLVSSTPTISPTPCQLGWLVNLTFTHCPSVGGTHPTMGIPVPHGTQNEGSGMGRTFVPIVALT